MLKCFVILTNLSTHSETVSCLKNTHDILEKCIVISFHHNIDVTSSHCPALNHSSLTFVFKSKICNQYHNLKHIQFIYLLDNNKM